jgi:hypothetical protein
MDDRLRQRVFALACVALLAAGGCSKFDLRKNIPWGGGKDGKLTRPMKLIAVWQDTVLHTDGQEAVRGFGGRVWFYGGDEEPVTVKGSLEVYAFDETGRKDTDTDPPDRKYVFTPEDVERHHSEGKLGDSYSFWLPWGDANGPPIEMTLICRFTPSDGSCRRPRSVRGARLRATRERVSERRGHVPKRGHAASPRSLRRALTLRRPTCRAIASPSRPIGKATPQRGAVVTGWKPLPRARLRCRRH